jgi:hypothetical protein
MKNAIYIILGLISAIVAVWRMWIYLQPAKQGGESMTDMAIFIVCVLLALVFIGLYLAGKVNKEEEIHITK